MALRSPERPWLGLLAVALIGACESSSTPAAATVDVSEPEDESALINADLCEHATEGPFKTLAATVDQASAPEAYFSHTLLTVTGTGAAGIHYVKLSVSEGGEHVIGVRGATAVSITDGTGTTVEFEKEEAVTACEEMETAYHVGLGVGTAYLAFEVAGAEATFVILVGEEHDETK